MNNEWKNLVGKLLGQYTQNEAANLVCVSNGTIGNWKKGILPVDLEMVRRLATATGQDPEELVNRVKEWSLSTSLKSEYNLTDSETQEVESVLKRVLAKRKK